MFPHIQVVILGEKGKINVSNCKFMFFNYWIFIGTEENEMIEKNQFIITKQSNNLNTFRGFVNVPTIPIENQIMKNAWLNSSNVRFLYAVYLRWYGFYVMVRFKCGLENLEKSQENIRF